MTAPLVIASVSLPGEGPDKGGASPLLAEVGGEAKP